MKLTVEDIKEINSMCPENQGVFSEPNGIPVDVKTPVVYMRWETGGWRGGSCWEGGVAKPYQNEEGKPKFKVLDLVLKKLKPDISFLDFREIEELIHTNSETDREYYGNSTDYDIEYIILSELEEKIKQLNK